jgi:hypothetical protein
VKKGIPVSFMRYFSSCVEDEESINLLNRGDWLARMPDMHPLWKFRISSPCLRVLVEPRIHLDFHILQMVYLLIPCNLVPFKRAMHTTLRISDSAGINGYLVQYSSEQNHNSCARVELFLRYDILIPTTHPLEKSRNVMA